MTTRKILVEFELDPTEYMAEAKAEGTDSDPVLLPDTQEAVHQLVSEMFKGNVDICNTRIVGDLVLLFRGKAAAHPNVHPKTGPQHLDSLSAIMATLQEFQRKRPLAPLKGPISITCIPPMPNRPYYEVSVWKQPTEILTTAPTITDA